MPNQSLLIVHCNQILTFTPCPEAESTKIMLRAVTLKPGTLSALTLPKVLCQLEQACNVAFYADALSSILFSSALSLFVLSLSRPRSLSISLALCGCRIHGHKAVSQQS